MKFLFSIVFIAWTSAGLALAPCDDLSVVERLLRSWNDSDVSQDFFLVDASFFAIKDLNTALGNKTVLTESIVNFIHYAFYSHIRKSLSDDRDAIIGFGRAAYLKSSRFTVKVPPAERSYFVSKVIEAKTIAAAKLQAFLESPETIAQEYREVFESATNLSVYNFAGENFINQISGAEMRDFVRPALVKYFGSEKDLGVKLLDQYGVGAGSSETDATFASRLASRSPDTSAIEFFSLATFAQTTEELVVLKKEFDPVFKIFSEAELQQFFSEVRKNLNKQTDDWSLNYVSLVQKVAQTINRNPLDVHRDLATYLRKINVLDFLPLDWLKVDPEARKRFDGFKEGNVVIYADAFGLGGRNISVIHKKLEDIDMAAHEIVTLARLRRENIDQVSLVSRRIDELTQVRTYILQESAIHLSSLAQTFRSALLEAGLQESDFVIWNSGDDFFVKARSANANHLVASLSNNETLRQNVRLGFMRIEKGMDYPLANARIEIGEVATTLKILEHQAHQTYWIAEVNRKTNRLEIFKSNGAGLVQDFSPAEKKAIAQVSN